MPQPGVVHEVDRGLLEQEEVRGPFDVYNGCDDDGGGREAARPLVARKAAENGCVQRIYEVYINDTVVVHAICHATVPHAFYDGCRRPLSVVQNYIGNDRRDRRRGVDDNRQSREVVDRA